MIKLITTRIITELVEGLFNSLSSKTISISKITNIINNRKNCRLKVFWTWPTEWNPLSKIVDIFNVIMGRQSSFAVPKSSKVIIPTKNVVLRRL